MLPSFIISFSPAVMRYDEDLDMRCSHSRNQLVHIAIKADCLSCLFGTLIELSSFTHEIIVRINYQYFLLRCSWRIVYPHQYEYYICGQENHDRICQGSIPA